MAVMWNTDIDWDNDGWRDRAACRSTDASLFFPAGSTGLALGQIQAAKAVCGSCPVQDACLHFALSTNQDIGIWGGRDEAERDKLRRALRSTCR